jgi:hypothetical protein
MPLARFEPTIPVLKRAKTFHALDRSATVSGTTTLSLMYNTHLILTTAHMSSQCAMSSPVVAR